jgi:hypothetical protein
MSPPGYRSISYLLGTAAFFYIGWHQFYLRRNVDRLERAGKLSSEAAARIRKKPMRLIGCLCLSAGLAFLALAFMDL